MPGSVDSRSILKVALQRRLAGEPAGEICDSLPCPGVLDQTEKSAWLLLRNWADDAPLRQGYASHAQYSRNRLTHLLTVLQ